MSDAPPIIHIVDDDRSFRTAIGRLLQASGYQVAFYESGDQLLQRPPPDQAGCLLLDVRMSGLSGLQLQTRLAAMNCALPIIFLTGHGDIPQSVQAIKAGAEDFLSKPVTREILLAAVERALVHDTERRTSRERLRALRARVAALTPREAEVLALVVRGKLNKQAAFELGTSVRTIKAHRHHITEKLGVRSVAELTLIAERLEVATSDLPPARLTE